MKWLAIFLSLASVASADPLKAWEDGYTDRAWQELERRPRDFLCKARFLHEDPTLGLANVVQAERLGRTPRQRCEVALERLEVSYPAGFQFLGQEW